MIKKLRGVRDIFDEDAAIFQFIMDSAHEVFKRYGFSQIILPIIERTELFSRGIGDETDIVQKEMYTFSDKKGRSITLRPEGTAVAVRSYIENGFDKRGVVKKYFYAGPMFRYERPQKGRYRQFYQLGVEVFGISDPYLDAEVLKMLMEFLEMIGIKETYVSLNNIGCSKCRPDYQKALKTYLGEHKERLCEDCKSRMDKNPLRVLDCKVQTCKEVTANAPLIADYLCDECKEYEEKFLHYLDIMEIPYKKDLKLVRGLDYYTRIVFEVYSDKLGAQSALLGGGRYDGLVEELGGKSTPAFGFAIGIDRIIEVLKESEKKPWLKDKKLYIVWELDDKAPLYKVVDMIRKMGYVVEFSYEKKSMKAQMKYAGKNGYEYVVFLGEREIDGDVIHLKEMETGKEYFISPLELLDFLR